jgi:hypothetical protein
MLNDPSVATKSWHMACVSGLKTWVGRPPRRGAAAGGQWILAPGDAPCERAADYVPRGRVSHARSEMTVEGATLVD